MKFHLWPGLEPEAIGLDANSSPEKSQDATATDTLPHHLQPNLEAVLQLLERCGFHLPHFCPRIVTVSTRVGAKGQESSKETEPKAGREKHSFASPFSVWHSPEVARSVAFPGSGIQFRGGGDFTDPKTQQPTRTAVVSLTRRLWPWGPSMGHKLYEPLAGPVGFCTSSSTCMVCPLPLASLKGHVGLKRRWWPLCWWVSNWRPRSLCGGWGAGKGGE